MINQIGAIIELHGHTKEAIVFGKLSNERLQEYRDYLAQQNPDLRYATFGQVVSGAAERWFDAIRGSCEGVTLSPLLWQYNASSDTYERA